MKHIQVFEQFKEGPMEKPQGFFKKMIQGAKHSLGFENATDRKDLDSLHRTLNASHEYDFINGVREIKPGVLVAYIANGNVTVDINTPEIMYKGRVLDLNNMEEEAEYLYNRLKRLTESLSVNESEKSHEDIMEVINFIKYNIETMDIGAEEAIVFITNAKSKMPWLLSKPNGETTQEWKELIDWIYNKYPQLNRMSNILSKELKPWQKNLNRILKQPMWPRPGKSQMN